MRDVEYKVGLRKWSYAKLAKVHAQRMNGKDIAFIGQRECSQIIGNYFEPSFFRNQKKKTLNLP